MWSSHGRRTALTCENSQAIALTVMIRPMPRRTKLTTVAPLAPLSSKSAVVDIPPAMMPNDRSATRTPTRKRIQVPASAMTTGALLAPNRTAMGTPLGCPCWGGRPSDCVDVTVDAVVGATDGGGGGAGGGTGTGVGGADVAGELGTDTRPVG